MKETDSKRGCLAIKPRNIGFEEATSASLVLSLLSSSITVLSYYSM